MASTESQSGTVVNSPPTMPNIVDAAGNIWILQKSATQGLQVSVNGTIDQTTQNVTQIEYYNGVIYMQSGGQWSSKNSPTAAWVSSGAPGVTPSPDGTAITTTTAKLIDNNGNVWTLVSSASLGLQVACNNVVDTTTQQVVTLEWFGGKIYQKNAANLWWSKSNPGDTWTSASAPSQSTNPGVPTSTTGVQALSADAFVESIGVNFGIPSQITGTQAQGVANVLKDLGIRHLRTGLYMGPINGLTRSSAMPNGVRMLVGLYADVNTIVNGCVNMVTQYPGALEIIEGTNEPDLAIGGSTWAAQAVSLQKQLWAAVQAQPKLAGIPVSSPPLSNADPKAVTQQLIQAGIGGYYSAISSHDAYQSVQPEVTGWPGSSTQTYIDYVLQNGIKPLQTIVSNNAPQTTLQGYTGGKLPVWFTEGGTTGSGTGLSSEANEAIYLPRHHLINFVNGFTRFYKYELYPIDDPRYAYVRRNYNASPMPAPPFTAADVKPVYFSIKNLIQLLADPPVAVGPDTFQPGKLDYSLSGATFSGPTGLPATTQNPNTNVYHTLFQKRNGSFVMCFWQYQTTNPTTVLTQNPGPGPLSPTKQITINVKNVTKYQTASLSTNPTMNNWSASQSIQSGAVKVNVTDAVTLVQLS